MDGKVSMVFNRSCFPKMNDFSRLGVVQAVVHRKSGSIKEMVQYRHAVTTPLTGNIIWLIYSCHFQWSWMTLKVIRVMQDLWNAIRRTFVRHLARFLLPRRVARSIGISTSKLGTFINYAKVISIEFCFHIIIIHWRQYAIVEAWRPYDRRREWTGWRDGKSAQPCCELFAAFIYILIRRCGGTSHASHNREVGEQQSPATQHGGIKSLSPADQPIGATTAGNLLCGPLNRKMPYTFTLNYGRFSQLFPHRLEYFFSSCSLVVVWSYGTLNASLHYSENCETHLR